VAAREPEVNAVNRILALVATASLLAGAPQISGAQATEEPMRAEFQAVIDGLNDNTFRKFHDAINDKALMDRIVGARVIDAQAREAFAADFASNLETMFTASFPKARSNTEASGDIIGTVIAFQQQDGQANAIVRYKAKGYRFTYHAYDLARGRGGRLSIIDWFDFYNASWFSEDAGNMLVRSMPAQASVRSVLETPNPTDGQLFQIGELFKAVRDQNSNRFFQIYDGLDDVLRGEPLVVTLNFQYSRLLGNAARMNLAVQELVANFPGDSNFGLSLAEYYISRGLFEEAIVEYDRFAGVLGMKDGVTESFKASSAMALGDFGRAEQFALSATEVEPDLELSWWSLLRARTAAQNYAGATEALTQLEDRFGHLLIPQELRRDRFLRILIDQQEYKDWRSARDQA
jgi:hypothetical protein